MLVLYFHPYCSRCRTGLHEELGTANLSRQHRQAPRTPQVWSRYHRLWTPSSYYRLLSRIAFAKGLGFPFGPPPLFHWLHPARFRILPLEQTLVVSTLSWIPPDGRFLFALSLARRLVWLFRHSRLVPGLFLQQLALFHVWRHPHSLMNSSHQRIPAIQVLPPHAKDWICFLHHPRVVI